LIIYSGQVIYTYSHATRDNFKKYIIGF
jgi:hypothetical protein